MQPRYPTARVHLRSQHPLVLISAVRSALRQAGAPREEIQSFSESAFDAGDSGTLLRLCQEWAAVETARAEAERGGGPQER